MMEKKQLAHKTVKVATKTEYANQVLEKHVQIAHMIVLLLVAMVYVSVMRTVRMDALIIVLKIVNPLVEMETVN